MAPNGGGQEAGASTAEGHGRAGLQDETNPRLTFRGEEGKESRNWLTDDCVHRSY